jgi:hypothetical protein
MMADLPVPVGPTNIIGFLCERSNLRKYCCLDVSSVGINNSETYVQKHMYHRNLVRINFSKEILEFTLALGAI